MREKVGVYFRCSTDKQDTSIADQRRIVSEFADKNNMEIVSWFDKDEGRSGTSFEKRPDFMRMISIIESGRVPFTKILVYDVDRWGRPIDPRESTYWEYHCKRYGVDIIYIQDQSINQNTLAGRLTKVIKQELATDESKKQSLRVRERSKLRASEGYRVGGFAPYGYRRLLLDKFGNKVKALEDGERKYEKEQRVVLIPGNRNEIKVVQRIFGLRAKGESIRGIANTLNGEGIPSPNYGKPRRRSNVSGKWCINTIWKILKNPVYKGDLLYNRAIRGSWAKHDNLGRAIREVEEWIYKEGAFEATVPREIFDRVNSNPRKSSYQGGRGYDSDYFLSGLLVCKNCGCGYQGHLHRSKYGQWRYYEDAGYTQKGSSVCSSFHIPKDLVEGFVLKEIRNKILRQINMDRLSGFIKKRLCELDRYRAVDTTEIDKELADVHRKIENIKDSIEDGVDVDFIKDRLEKLDKKRLVLEGQKLALTSKNPVDFDVDKTTHDILNLSNSLDDVLLYGSNREKKQRIRCFVSKLEVDQSLREVKCYLYKIPRVVNLPFAPDLRHKLQQILTRRGGVYLHPYPYCLFIGCAGQVTYKTTGLIKKREGDG